MGPPRPRPTQRPCCGPRSALPSLRLAARSGCWPPTSCARPMGVATHSVAAGPCAAATGPSCAIATPRGAVPPWAAGTPWAATRRVAATTWGGGTHGIWPSHGRWAAATAWAVANLGLTELGLLLPASQAKNWGPRGPVGSGSACVGLVSRLRRVERCRRRRVLPERKPDLGRPLLAWGLFSARRASPEPPPQTHRSATSLWLCSTFLAELLHKVLILEAAARDVRAHHVGGPTAASVSQLGPDLVRCCRGGAFWRAADQ